MLYLLTSFGLCFLLLSFSPAHAAFQYIDDQSCNKYGGASVINAAAAEALTAVNAAMAAIKPPRKLQFTRLLISMIGMPSTDTDRDAILQNFYSAYETLANALGPEPNDIYVYCGTSTVYSNRKPDPKVPNSASKFDPTNPNNAFTAGIPCDPSDNGGLGFYYYAPDPTENQAYIQISGINMGVNPAPGQSLCTIPLRPYGYSWVNGDSPHSGPKFITLCLDNADGPAFTSSNANAQYWMTPAAVGAKLGAHLGSLSHKLIHEMGHCLGTADDQIINGQKAYGIEGVMALAKANWRKSPGDNTAWKNCDTQGLFAMGSLMDACDWAANDCRNPATVG